MLETNILGKTISSSLKMNLFIFYISKLIDLDFIPTNIREQIIEKYNNIKIAPKMKVLNYLVVNRLSNLVPSASDFFPHENTNK